MGKSLHIICGNCGSDEDLSYRISGETVNVVCTRCFKTTDLSGVIQNTTPGFDKSPSEVAEGEDAMVWLVRLTNAGRSKLHLVKAIKDMTGLGLREAKDLADFEMGASNGIVFDNRRKREALEAAAALKLAGATVVIENSLTQERYEP
jgi:large subunit ribosomal protein L7/L12